MQIRVQAAERPFDLATVVMLVLVLIVVSVPGVALLWELF